MDFLGVLVVKNPPANTGNPGSSLVWEDPTSRRATKPVHRNCRARMQELVKPKCPGDSALQQEKLLQWESPHMVPAHSTKDLAQPELAKSS